MDLYCCTRDNWTDQESIAILAAKNPKWGNKCPATTRMAKLTMMVWASTNTGGQVHWGKSQVFCDIPDLWVGYTQIDTHGVFFSLRSAPPIGSEYSACMVDHIKLWSESTAIPATCTIDVKTEQMSDQRKRYTCMISEYFDPCTRNLVKILVKQSFARPNR